MTRRSKRELQRDVDGLRASSSDEDGFLVVSIGGDPGVSGYYTWDSDRGVYVNETGAELPHEDAPDGEFECNIECLEEP